MICSHYTGFPTLNRLYTVFEFIDTGSNGQNVILYQNQDNKETGRGRNRSLPPLSCYILTLIRLRRNLSVSHLAFLFGVKETTVSTTVTTWINYLFIQFGSIPIRPSMDQVRANMPSLMKEKFPNVKCIIDGVEF